MQLVSSDIQDSDIHIEAWAAKQGYIVDNVREVPNVRVFICDIVAYDPEPHE